MITPASHRVIAHALSDVAIAESTSKQPLAAATAPVASRLCEGAAPPRHAGDEKICTA